MDNHRSQKNIDPFFPRSWQLAHEMVLELGPVSRIMGILNVTPDSFSDGGNFITVGEAVDQAARMVDDGADIIDVGGETTKPGAIAIDRDMEQERVLPVIRSIKERFDTIISIDTYRSDTAQLALEAGAHLVNDVGGFLFDKKMASVVTRFGAGACLMHNSRDRDVGDEIVSDQIEYLCRCVLTAKNSGVTDSQIVLDPGFGFGKDINDNLSLLEKFGLLQEIGFPLLAGTSRKRFTGSVLGEDDTTENRDTVTAATNVIARMAGCAIFRVHDVKTNRLALNLADAVLNTR